RSMTVADKMKFLGGSQPEPSARKGKGRTFHRFQFEDVSIKGATLFHILDVNRNMVEFNDLHDDRVSGATCRVPGVSRNRNRNPNPKSSERILKLLESKSRIMIEGAEADFERMLNRRRLLWRGERRRRTGQVSAWFDGDRVLIARSPR